MLGVCMATQIDLALKRSAAYLARERLEPRVLTTVGDEV